MRNALAIAGLALALAGAAHGSEVNVTLEGRVKTYTLKNGMTFLLVERHESATVACWIKFAAGSVDEYDGIGGTAHMLEHMLFKGTQTLGTKDYAAESKVLEKIAQVGEALDTERLKREQADKAKLKELGAQLTALQTEAAQYVVKDEIDGIYSRNGGVGFNASTEDDVTTYTIELPSNRMELWCRIEADRMMHPVLREYYSERDVILEERRMRVDANPEGTLWEQFTGALYRGHRYGMPVIGYMPEVSMLSLGNTAAFRLNHYAPNHTVAAIVGDIHPDTLMPMLEKYFGPIPSQPVARPISSIEPDQIGERRIEVEADASPQLLIGWHKVQMPAREDNIFDVIDGVLTTGRSSRLYKRLVKDEQLAVSVSSTDSFPGSRYPNCFVIAVTPRQPHTAAECEKVVLEEIERLKKEPVGDHDLQKVKNQIQADFVRGLDSNEGLASQLSYFQAILGDWHHLERQVHVIQSITAKEIMEIARERLTHRNQTVAVLVRPSQEAASDAGKAGGGKAGARGGAGAGGDQGQEQGGGEGGDQ